MKEREALPTDPQAAFVVGCPRSGTHFLAELFRQTPGFTSLHCDDVGKAEGDSYLGYMKWHKLPVHLTPLVDWRASLIRDAQRQGTSFVEANCYLSLVIPELHARLRNRFVFTVRHPVDVVNSLFVKGWYEEPFPLQPTYHYQMRKANHSFGRLSPTDPGECERWNHLTRIGRIAWFWNALNVRILADLQQVPKDQWTLIYLNAFDYCGYLDVMQFLGCRGTIAERDFFALVERRPGRGPQHHSREEWSPREAQEFAQETSCVRERLGLAL